MPRPAVALDEAAKQNLLAGIAHLEEHVAVLRKQITNDENIEAIHAVNCSVGILMVASMELATTIPPSYDASVRRHAQYISDQVDAIFRAKFAVRPETPPIPDITLIFSSGPERTR